MKDNDTAFLSFFLIREHLHLCLTGIIGKYIKQIYITSYDNSILNDHRPINWF